MKIKDIYNYLVEENKIGNFISIRIVILNIILYLIAIIYNEIVIMFQSIIIIELYIKLLESIANIVQSVSGILNVILENKRENILNIYFLILNIVLNIIVIILFIDKEEILQKYNYVKLYFTIWSFNNSGKIVTIIYMTPFAIRCMMCWKAMPSETFTQVSLLKPMFNTLMSQEYTTIKLSNVMNNRINKAFDLEAMMLQETNPENLIEFYNENKDKFYGLPQVVRKVIMSNLQQKAIGLSHFRHTAVGTALADGYFHNNKIDNMLTKGSKANSNLTLSGGSLSAPYINYMFNNYFSIFCTIETVVPKISERSNNLIEVRFWTQRSDFWTKMHIEFYDVITKKKKIPEQDYLLENFSEYTFKAMLAQDGGQINLFNKTEMLKFNVNAYNQADCNKLQIAFEERLNIQSEIQPILSRNNEFQNTIIIRKPGSIENARLAINSIGGLPSEAFGYKVLQHKDIYKLGGFTNYNTEQKRALFAVNNDIPIEHLKQTAKSSINTLQNNVIILQERQDDYNQIMSELRKGQNKEESKIISNIEKNIIENNNYISKIERVIAKQKIIAINEEKNFEINKLKVNKDIKTKNK